VTTILCPLLTIYMVILIARAILSWFPVGSGSSLASINRLLLDVTEPVIAPVRRVLPPAGFLDLSFLVVFIVLGIVRGAICGGGILL
jgi:YggT family protein